MQSGLLKRREFITLLGGATAWPLVARAQRPAVPVIGLLHPASPDTLANRLRGFRQGLKETGFVEDENVAIEQRWAGNQLDRLPELAAALVRREASVIVAFGPDAVFAAKAATTAIPIVFGVPEDPVRLGLVPSLARPVGNVTGINWLSGELVAKRLELLRELVPVAARVAVLANPADAAATETTLREVTVAARAMGLQIQILNASTSREINAVFATIARDRRDAIFVASDPFFQTRRVQFAALAAHHAVPATYASRDYPEAGGLMSYGANVTDAWRQTGAYAGRILKDTKPADLPVMQSSKFELVINAEIARMLGLTVPDKLLVAANEVIE
jgi:putative tryptophan/tyrosine transport system substrate-binding protein